MGASGQHRGGRFASAKAAQAQLVPREIGDVLPPPVTVTPTAIPQAQEHEPPVALPKEGEGGDLMAVMDGTRQCTLWFCVRPAGGGQPARWAQVLLGPEFDGRS